MNIEETIRSTFAEILDSMGSQVNAPLEKQTLLLGSGLDSLGFAILVARLEESLGYDPFIRMEEPVYPQTFGDFLTIYEKYQPAK